METVTITCVHDNSNSEIGADGKRGGRSAQRQRLKEDREITEMEPISAEATVHRRSTSFRVRRHETRACQLY